MKFNIVLILALLMWTDPGKISKINAAKAEAKKAFNDGHYKEAVKKYRYLIDSLGVSEDEVSLNLANAYYLSKDTANARTLYQGLTQSPKNELRSNAFQQLGLINNNQGKSEEALKQFKQAIKANPTNEDARYNYEMLKKKLEEQKKKDQQKQDQNKDKKDQNKDQKDQDKKEDEKKDPNKKDDPKNKKDQEEKDKKDQQKKDQEKKEQEEKEKKEQEKKDQQNKDKKEGKDDKDKEKKEKEDKAKEQKDQKEDQQKKDDQKVPQQVSDKLKQMNISEEKAKMILEAMKNQEVQYLQQNKRKASKPKDRGKPDW